jgi:hypothetical protein
MVVLLPTTARLHRFSDPCRQSSCLPQSIVFIEHLQLASSPQVPPLVAAFHLQRRQPHLQPHYFLALFIIPIPLLIHPHPHLCLLPVAFVRPLEVRRAAIRLVHFPLHR